MDENRGFKLSHTEQVHLRLYNNSNYLPWSANIKSDSENIVFGYLHSTPKRITTPITFTIALETFCSGRLATGWTCGALLPYALTQAGGLQRAWSERSVFISPCSFVVFPPLINSLWSLPAWPQFTRLREIAAHISISAAAGEWHQRCCVGPLYCLPPWRSQKQNTNRCVSSQPELLTPLHTHTDPPTNSIIDVSALYFVVLPFFPCPFFLSVPYVAHTTTSGLYSGNPLVHLLPVQQTL